MFASLVLTICTFTLGASYTLGTKNSIAQTAPAADLQARVATPETTVQSEQPTKPVQTPEAAVFDAALDRGAAKAAKIVGTGILTSRYSGKKVVASAMLAAADQKGGAYLEEVQQETQAWIDTMSALPQGQAQNRAVAHSAMRVAEVRTNRDFSQLGYAPDHAQILAQQVIVNPAAIGALTTALNMNDAAQAAAEQAQDEAIQRKASQESVAAADAKGQSALDRLSNCQINQGPGQHGNPRLTKPRLDCQQSMVVTFDVHRAETAYGSVDFMAPPYMPPQQPAPPHM